MTTIASAKFTDDSSINNSEAVEVMSMINVINGYTDGSFRPDGNVTRAQMAKMVAYIVSGGEDVGNLYAGANSFSDCTTHWAKGYIAYANKTGIVAGVGNGKFNPEGSVTGTQVAKMMLCALGYDAGIEEYTGTNWAVNVLADAKAAGLLEGLTSVDMSKAMSRQDAAQLMFNALKADTVDYENRGTTVDLGNGVTFVTGASSAKPVEDKNETGNYAGDGSSSNRPAGYGYTQLCEKYFPKLTVADSTDAFGRTGSQWTYKDGSTTKESAVYAAAPAYTIVVSKDGENASYWAKEAYSKLTVAGGNVVTVNGDTSSKQAASANLNVGDVVEFYLDDDNNKLADEVFVTRYSADVITEVDTDVSDADADDGVTAYITFEGIGQFKDTDITGYNANTFKKDAVVALIEGTTGDYADTIVASYIPESVEGAITAYSQANKTYTMGGTKYTLTGTADDEVNYSVDFEDGNYKLYLDTNGYVLKTEAIKGTASISDVFYLAKLQNNDMFWSEKSDSKGTTNYTYYVQAVYLDGTIKDLEIASFTTKDLGGSSTETANLGKFETSLKAVLSSGTFFTDEAQNLAADADGSVETIETSLTKWSNSDYSASADVSGDIDDASSKIEIKEADKTLNGAYLTSKTNYLVVESYADTAKTTVKTGGISFAGNSNNDQVYIITNADTKEALYVVIATDSYSTAATGDFFYVADDTKTSVSGGTQYTVIGMDGKKMDIVVDKDNSDIKTLSAGEVYEYAVLTNGNYNVTKKLAAADNVETTYYESHFNTLLTVNGNTKVVETSGAAIYDDHDTDIYDRNINTLTAMKTATDKGWTVNLIVVYSDSDKDEAKMIIVTGPDAAQQDTKNVAATVASLKGMFDTTTDSNDGSTSSKPWVETTTVNADDGNGTITLLSGVNAGSSTITATLENANSTNVSAVSYANGKLTGTGTSITDGNVVVKLLVKCNDAEQTVYVQFTVAANAG